MTWRLAAGVTFERENEMLGQSGNLKQIPVTDPSPSNCNADSMCS
jgi:hypothetical protein